MPPVDKTDKTTLQTPAVTWFEDLLKKYDPFAFPNKSGIRIMVCNKSK